MCLDGKEVNILWSNNVHGNFASYKENRSKKFFIGIFWRLLEYVFKQWKFTRKLLCTKFMEINYVNYIENLWRCFKINTVNTEDCSSFLCDLELLNRSTRILRVCKWQVVFLRQIIFTCCVIDLFIIKLKMITIYSYSVLVLCQHAMTLYMN